MGLEKMFLFTDTAERLYSGLGWTELERLQLGNRNVVVMEKNLNNDNNNKMINLYSAIKRLEYLCDTIPKLLTEIGEPAFSLKPTQNKWSKKEIIGHLIDSATNNHQRFVRGQFEETPTIVYNQDKWNEYSFHQQIDGQQIINFWAISNRQLIEFVRRIPQENLQRERNSRDNKSYTLDFLFNDCVEHLEHHLRQVVTY